MAKALTASDIIKQKLEHIKYFSDDDINEVVLIGIARDACYTANNSLNFKKKQLADTLAEYDRHVAEEDKYSAERSERYASRLYTELEVFEERLHIEKTVYFSISGEEWHPTQKRTVARKSVGIEALRKKIA